MPEKETGEDAARPAASAAATLQPSGDLVLGELMKLAFVNIHDYMHFAGGQVSLDLTRLTRDHAAGIVELTATARPQRRADGDVVAELTDVKVKLADKRQALVEIGRHLGLFRERPEPPPAPAGIRPDLSDPNARLELARDVMALLAEAKEIARRTAQAKPTTDPGNASSPRSAG